MDVSLRVFAITALLLSMFVFVIQPALAVSASKQLRDPSLTLNTGSFMEFMWWEHTFDSTPVQVSHLIQDPTGLTVHTDSWNITGATSPLYNPEDPTGANQGDLTNLNFAHKWVVPAGANPGIYTSRVRYYSSEILNGNPPDDFNWENESAVTFRVEQPWQVFKYNDLDGNGKFDVGEPGLDSWHFSITGPGGYSFSGNTSGEGFLELPEPTIAGAYTITETLLSGWRNTDPGGSATSRRTVVVPGDLIPADPTILFGNQEIAPAVVITPALLPRSTVEIFPANPPVYWVIPRPGWVVNQPYTATLAAIGGKGTYTWSATGLPPGLSLDPATGIMSGTPNTPGDFIITFTVSDSFSPANTASKVLLFKIYLVGDANGDGEVNIGDVTMVERVLLGLNAPTAGCDVNLNGVISIGDVTRIDRIILGLP